MQSCATWVEAINKQPEPTRVSPNAEVPLLIVTYSRIVVALPITVWVFSPSNFKSCGISPIEDAWNILQSGPIFVSEKILTWLPIIVLSPILTPPSTIE